MKSLVKSLIMKLTHYGILLIALLAAQLNAGQALSTERIKGMIAKIEIDYFNETIGRYKGGIFFDIFGGSGKARDGFAKNQEAINREDYRYFPEDLQTRKGPDSEKILYRINEDAIIDRKAMAVFMQDYAKKNSLSTINPEQYTMAFGLYLWQKFGSIQRALITYHSGVQDVIRFNNSLSLGLFDGLIKSKMNEVSDFTAAKRAEFMERSMKQANPSASR